ncbi:MAG TPA: cysteate synthase [Bacteroidales bacterium]|nr:cysteate synthase [Bacteroidales bacterium]HPR57628.1 cysteate synthase [Bacteroidales bacterium]HRW97039.1 cysteate synthase [Bacteroidales bacterium]
MTFLSRPTQYKLQSLATGSIFEDTGWLLDPPGETSPSLIRAIYQHQQLNEKDDKYGLYKFADWLPFNRFLEGSEAPLTYKSKHLAQFLKLENLYVTYNGYWPEKGIEMPSCSFKETEAYSVCARMNGDNSKILVVASAGNTARAFARVCSDNNIPLLLCIPEDCLDVMWFDRPINNDNVKLIVTAKGSDYYDAIHLSAIAASFDPFIPEGGAKNIARRDGMGTTVLSATTYIGRIPDYYFQAVGSGTGAISAWEANLRLIADGRFGNHKMKLMVSQNEPFVPLHQAWKVKSRQLLPFDDETARRELDQIDAKVLSNRRPPYSITGGLFDALTDSNGEVLTVNNQKVREAAALFEQLEGIDIHPASGVATASLIEWVQKNSIDKDAIIMLNITGGGEERFKKEKKLFYMKPDLVFGNNPDTNEVKRKLEKLFAKKITLFANHFSLPKVSQSSDNR